MTTSAVINVCQPQSVTSTLVGMNRLSFLRYLTFLAGAVTAGCASRPERASAAECTVLTYNIHHGEGTDGRLDLERIAQLIQAAGADLVALQEVDRGVTRTQRRDLPAELGKLTGLTPLFANNYAFDGGEYGNAILTRYPVRWWSNHHFQMIRPGEQRGLLQAVVDVKGREVVFLSTHLDHRPDDAERLSCVPEILSALSAQGTRPVLLCGDFNDTPESRVIARLSEAFRDGWAAVGQGPGPTYPSEGPVKRIDYIWLRGPVQPVSAEVITSEASDHAALRLVVRLD